MCKRHDCHRTKTQVGSLLTYYELHTDRLGKYTHRYLPVLSGVHIALSCRGHSTTTIPNRIHHKC